MAKQIPEITDVTHLLEFLDAKEVAQLIIARKDITSGGIVDSVAVWHWISQRMRTFFPHIDIPAQPPSPSAMEPSVLVALLRRLHVVMTYQFDLHFDAKARNRDVHLADTSGYISNWGVTGGSIFGDRNCVRDSVSYWECCGLSEGSYVGIAELPSPGNQIFSFQNGQSFQRSERMLSMPPPASDHIPAIMYSESGFITNGNFRGQRPRLPSGVRFLHAQPFKEQDHVGIFVDLLEGYLVFLVNGERQALPIPIDRNKTYCPVFSARACYNLKLVAQAQPPWHKLYDFDDMQQWMDTIQNQNKATGA